MLKIGAKNITGLYVGEEKITKAYLGADLVFSAKKPSRLPEGYAELEYIQNADYTSYISPGKTLHFGSDFVFTFSATEIHTSRDQTYIHAADNFFLQIKYLDKSISWAIKSGSTWSYATIYQNTQANAKITVSYTYADGAVDVNGTKTTVSYPRGTPSLPSTIKSKYSSPIARFYYFKGKSSTYPDSNVYNFELIPCINPSGIVGLYDLTNSTFIGPTNGTFIAGPAV